MAQYTLLHGARQLLTLRGLSGARRGSTLSDLGIIEDGAILIQDGTIAAVGPSRRIENLKEARKALSIDLGGLLVMPGFADAGMAISMQTEIPEDGTPGRLKKTRRVYDDGLSLMRSCLNHGTVAAELRACSDAGDFRADAAMLRQITKIGPNPVHLVRTWRLSAALAPEDAKLQFRAVLESLARRKQLDFIELSGPAVDIPDDLLSEIRQANVGLKLAWGGGGSARLETALRRIMPRAVLCAASLTEPELQVLARYPVMAVFSPGIEWAHDAALGLKRCAELGAAVALSSGYDANLSPGFSMQMAASLAIVQGQLRPEEAIAAATINAAHAMGFGHLAGSLEQGKRADILVADVPDYREISRRFGINHAAMVLRNGVTVFNRTRWKIGA